MKRLAKSRRTRLSLPVILGCLLCAATVAAQEQVPNQATQATAPAKSGVAAAVEQVSASLLATQETLRASRLAILKQVEAGSLSAEEALDALDKLPAPPRPSERLVWIKGTIDAGEEAKATFAFPLSVLTWGIEAFPRLMPPMVAEEMKQEVGIDPSALDLSGLALALDSLSQVQAKTTLLSVVQGQMSVVITLEPEVAQPREAESGPAAAD